MKRLTFATGIAICAVVLAAGSVLARSGPERAQMSFEQLDSNGDGQITRDEMTAMRDARIARADTNGDGSLSLEELQNQASDRARARAEKMMERLDANDDGVLSASELTHEDRIGRMFDRADEDGDGSVSEEEFAQARKHRGGKHRHRTD